MVFFHFDHQDAPLVKQALRTEKPQYFDDAPFVLSYCDLMMQPCFPRWLMNTRAENRDRPNPSWLPLLPMFSPAIPGRTKPSCHRHPVAYFFFSLALCSFSTFLTIFCSSIRNARTMRSRTQLPHREPPYARWTVFLGLEIWAYSRGRRAGT